MGSNSYITDRVGKVTQHTEYIAFGEVLFDEHTTEVNMPYLFNGKELDQETGLYYYGARYYDARVSIFLNVDPLAEKYPFTSPYTYTNNNPIMLIDPTGMESEETNKPNDWYWNQKTKRVEWRNSSMNYIDEGNGNLLTNVGKTKLDVMRNYGIFSKKTIKEKSISGSVSWELHEDKTPNKGGIPVIKGSYDGIVSVLISNNLTTKKDNKNITYISGVNTTINATYYYNDQVLNIDNNTVFFSEVIPIYKYSGEGKRMWKSGLDYSPAINQFFGENFHPLNYYPITINTDFNQYITNGINFK